MTGGGGRVFPQGAESGHALHVSQVLHGSLAGHVSATALAHSCFSHLNWMSHRPSRSLMKSKALDNGFGFEINSFVDKSFSNNLASSS